MDFESQSKLIQFLIRFSNVFKLIQNSIISIDPLLSVNCVFYLILQVEKQKEDSKHLSLDFGASIFLIGKGSCRSVSDNKKDSNRKRPCFKHCNGDSHTINHYFELVGYSKWDKGRKRKKIMSQSNKATSNYKPLTCNMASNVVFETPFEYGIVEDKSEVVDSNSFSHSIINI